MRQEINAKMKLVENDPWLEPVADAVKGRFERYDYRYNEIKDQYGSISKFADLHNFLGFTYDRRKKGWFYREWAPAAYELFLIGDFNNWNRSSHPLEKNEDRGIWEIFIPKAEYEDKLVHGSKVKVLVHGENGWVERLPALIKATHQDEQTKNFSGVFYRPKRGFTWRGDNFSAADLGELCIYEAHTGMATEKYGTGSYREFADVVLPRIKDAGYNAVQMMAVAEHPYYGSFGYHVSSFFAPSSRFGSPDDLKYLIKKAHKLGIAFIMDIVHAHTVKNTQEGLNNFDGSGAQYCHAGERGNHPAWDSKLFDYGKHEVQQFLLSNIRYWMEEFHVDGFRFDGVTSMMYFHHGLGVDFGSQEGYFTDGVEFDAILYLQLANKLIHEINPNAISIAEDVSGMPGLTEPMCDGGIGFDYRLAMGIPDFWIKQLKEVKDEDWDVRQLWNTMLNRKFQDKTIAYAESHDQALVGDKTLAFRLMDQDMYWHMEKNSDSLVVDRGMALHKLIRFFTMSLGGNAYLNFMGNEFGHPEWIDFPREGNDWSYHYARRQWSLTENKELRYHQLADWDRAIVGLTHESQVMNADFPKELWYDEWHKTIAFERAGLVFLFNWHLNLSATDYEICVPEHGKYEILLSSDNTDFGGFGRIDEQMMYETFEGVDGNPRLRLYNTNRTAFVLKRIDEQKKEKSKPKIQKTRKVKAKSKGRKQA